MRKIRTAANIRPMSWIMWRTSRMIGLRVAIMMVEVLMRRSVAKWINCRTRMVEYAGLEKVTIFFVSQLLW